MFNMTFLIKYCYRICSVLWLIATGVNIVGLHYDDSIIQWALFTMSFSVFGMYVFYGWKEYKNEL